MFQRPALLPWRSVLDNVLLPVELSGTRRAAHRERAEELLHMVQIVEINIPRPRTLGPGAHLAEAARAGAELHELLMSGP